jgi:molecular chaperone DnaK
MSAGASDQPLAVGIDLGTTNSVVAAIVDGELQVVRDREGRALVPSVVAFAPNGKTLVGRKARERILIDGLNTIFSAKRIIGRPFSAADTQAIINHLPYTVVSGENEEPLIQTRAGPQSAIDISSRVLAHLRSGAEHAFGRKVSACVVTVPANFTDGQREATHRAAEAAGMQVLRILNEPTAAACALGFQGSENKKVVVFDMGGGTFDATVLHVHDNIFEVLATGGEPYLGGDDFDRAVADLLVRRFLAEHRIDLNADPELRARVLDAARQIKSTLSDEEVATGTIPGIVHGEGTVPLDLNYRVTRQEFELLIRPFVEYAVETTTKVLQEADLTPTQLDEVALVGGSTFVPAIRRRVSNFFGRHLRGDVNPMEAVAVGAALQAHKLHAAGRPVAASGPDDLTNSALLMDVTSHAFGIATVGDNVQILIPKNTTIPCEGSSEFSTVKDNQTQVNIRVCQGDQEHFSDAAPLGEVRLTGLRPAPRGETRVAVEFLVDANGILQVSARDLDTGRQAQATLSVLGINTAG